MLTYATARTNAADLRQYLAIRKYSAELRGEPHKVHYHVNFVVGELAELTGLPREEIRENLDADVEMLRIMNDDTFDAVRARWAVA